MAGNMDPNEMQGVAEAMEELRKGSTLSAESLTKLGGNSTTAYKALESYTKSTLGIIGAMGSMSKAVAQGEGSFASLGSTIVGLTSVVGKLAGAIPLVGGAAKALAEGVGEAAKFVLDQLDIMAKNYQTLGDASAGAADGVDGLLRQFNQMGNYSLPAFSKAVKANTLGLAAFQGTAAAGAEELSKVSGVLTTGQMAQRFLKLGMGLNAVGDATTEYLSTSARYGLTQGQTTEELTKKTQNYIEEVDKIARLTGQTRESQQKEAQKSLVDAKFRAKIADMEANGQGAAAEELRKYVEGLGGAAGDAARALVTGIPLTKEAAAANLFANDAIRQNTLAVQDGKKATTAISDTQQALADGTVRFGKQVMYAGDQFGGVYIQAADTAAILKEQNKLMATGMTREQAIAKIQEKQMTASGKNTDAFTKGQLAVADSSKNLQSLGFSLAEAAIPAVELFATTLDDATSWMNKKFGLGGTSYKARDKNHGAAGGPAGEARDAATRDAAAKDTNAKAAGGSQNAEEALKFFQSAGWTKEQAAGIVGNLQAESGKNLDTHAVGDGGKAKGIAQWHPDRQATFRKQMGTDIENSSLQDQLKFIDWELKNTEKSAGDKLRAATSAAQAAQIIDKNYERSSGAHLGNRMANASGLAGPTSGWQNTLNDANPTAAGVATQTQADHADNKKANDSTLLYKSFAEMTAEIRRGNALAKEQLKVAKAA